jgi:anti-anti-sigma factor
MAATGALRPRGFRVWTEPDGEGLVVRAAGEMDIASAEAFEGELRGALAGEASTVTLDLGEVEFIDSSGLRVLLKAIGLSNETGTRFEILRRLSPAVERTFKIAGLAERLPFAG